MNWGQPRPLKPRLWLSSCAAGNASRPPLLIGLMNIPSRLAFQHLCVHFHQQSLVTLFLNSVLRKESIVTLRIFIVKRFRVCLFFTICTLLAVGLLAGCGSNPTSIQSSTSTQTPSSPGHFVGPVQNTTAWIGIVADQQKGKVVAYVCDSQSIGEWFSGTLKADGSFDLTSASSAHLQGTLTRSQVQGTFTPVGGSSLSFSAQPAVGKQGIYRVDEIIKGAHYLGGWVVGSNGQIEGVLHRDNARVDVSHIDPTHGAVKLPDGTTVTPGFISPDVGF